MQTEPFSITPTPAVSWLDASSLYTSLLDTSCSLNTNPTGMRTLADDAVVDEDDDIIDSDDDAAEEEELDEDDEEDDVEEEADDEA